MRIVGGEWKGRPIRPPRGKATRPTTDRVREAVFDAISSRIDGFEGERVLDAFAGSGALGLEALSRGADHASFVEKDPRTAALVKENVGSLGAAQRASVVTGDAFSLAGRIAGGPFTLLLLDPPYTLDASRVVDMLNALAAAGDIVRGAWIVWERAAGTPVDWPGVFQEDAVKRYGSTEIRYATYEGGPS